LSLPLVHTGLTTGNMPTADPGNSMCSQTLGNYLASCTAQCLYKLQLNWLVLYTSQTAHVTHPKDTKFSIEIIIPRSGYV